MIEVRYTRNLFLRGMCIIYLFAFLSLYVQIPGLYGDNGVLPARTQLDLTGKSSLSQKFNQKPTYLWLAPYLGLNVEYMLDVLALLGSLISFLGFISQRYCISPVFLLLWSLYYSIYQVGQVFVQYQWDTLLLEAGFLCVFIAPYFVPTQRKVQSPSDALTFWGIRWLLFRYMFSSGVVKLASGCPVWWNLEGLSHYFETECLPAPLAWYAHHIPTWYLRFNTVVANVFELVIPFLYFFPNRKIRIMAFYLQMYLQFHIITTGNWNFRDFLVICMSISLLDDQFFYRAKSKTNGTGIKDFLSTLICIIVYSAVLFATIVYYKMRFLKNWTIAADIGFTQEQFDNYLRWFVPAALYMGLISHAITVADAITHSILSTKGTINTIFTTITTLMCTAAVWGIFVLSIVPLSMLHPNHNMTIPTSIKHAYNKVGHLRIVNKHGLFDRMTGNARPEVIIEGSNNIDGPWREYEFLYKPGNVNNSLPLVAPHAPRLDWQMWFAARGTYHQNPWIMSLTYRLLSGQPEVLALLNNVENPFSDKPPKFIKASLYHYRFTPWRNTGNDQSWWTREHIGEYFPIFSRDHPPLLDYLAKMKVLPDKTVVKVKNEMLKTILDSIRMLLAKAETSLLLWSIFTAGCALIMTSGTNPPAKKH